MSRPIKAKERETIIQSLKSGVVPRAGLQHIQVGRSEELKSFIKDIDTISEGGTSFRFVIGEYGSGKTFFLSLVRNIALEKGLVTMHADLSPTKRLHGFDGQARLLLSELISSLSTRTKQDGNALVNILEKFISSIEEFGKSIKV
jgi:ABC-type polysaccharide/polyol phosphate transport system ATPase subunit